MTPAARRDLLAAVLDVVVPASGAFPAAGSVALDRVLAAAAASPQTERLFARGLQAVEDALREAGVVDLPSLDVDAREALLRRVEQTHGEFFAALVRATYEGYYGHPMVVALLGLDPGPVHPRGHRIEPVEAPSLDRVIARGPLHRQ